MYDGKELEVYDEHTWRPYCHVRDFARLLELVINTEKERVNFEVFNAGGDINNSTKKMLIDANSMTHLPNSKVTYSSNGNDPRNYRVSFKKVKTIGFEPKYTIKDGVKELIEALDLGLYNDSKENKNKYGNYNINYLD